MVFKDDFKRLNYFSIDCSMGMMYHYPYCSEKNEPFILKSLYLSYTHSLAYTHPLSLTRTLSLIRTLSLAYTHPLSLKHVLSLSLSLTHTLFPYLLRHFFFPANHRPNSKATPKSIFGIMKTSRMRLKFRSSGNPTIAPKFGLVKK